MTRILLSTDAVGGVWRYSIELAHGLGLRGATVVLAVLGPDPNEAQRGEAAGIAGLELRPTGLPLDWTAASPAALEIASRGLARLAGQTRADTVQLHSPALLGSVQWPMPVVAAAHSCVATWWRAVRGGKLPADMAWRAEAMANGLTGADAVIAPSASFAAALRCCYGLGRPVTVIANGRRPLSGRAGRRAGVLSAGRLWDAGKGMTTLDEAARRLGRPVRVAGPVEGPQGARGNFYHLDLLGSLNEASLADEYAGAAVFVSVALYEPFGLAVLEAAQSGCALILSDIPTFRELWHDVALFVPPSDPAGLADTLAALLDDPAACGRLGAMARMRAALFDPAKMIAATGDLHTAALVRKAA